MQKSKTYTFSPTTTAKSSEVNTNFDNAIQGINDIVAMPMNSILRNCIINPAMEIAQRGISFSGSTGQKYTLDRWCAFFNSALAKIEQIATDDVTGSFHLRYTLGIGAVSGCTRRVWQQILGCNARQFAGKPVTITFRARAGAGYSGTGNSTGALPNIYGGQANGLGVALFTGTGSDEAINIATGFPTGNVLKLNQAITMTTLWADYSIPVSALASNIKEMALLIYAPINAGAPIANDYFDIKDVRICVGNEPLPFMPKGYIQDLLDCLPFYETGDSNMISNGYTAGIKVGTQICFKAMKIKIPTVSFGTPSENANLGAATCAPITQWGFRQYCDTIGAGAAYLTRIFYAESEL